VFHQAPIDRGFKFGAGLIVHDLWSCESRSKIMARVATCHRPI
jgi:hypothetical protein